MVKIASHTQHTYQWQNMPNDLLAHRMRCLSRCALIALPPCRQSNLDTKSDLQSVRMALITSDVVAVWRRLDLDPEAAY